MNETMCNGSAGGILLALKITKLLWLCDFSNKLLTAYILFLNFVAAYEDFLTELEMMCTLLLIDRNSTGIHRVISLGKC